VARKVAASARRGLDTRSQGDQGNQHTRSHTMKSRKVLFEALKTLPGAKLPEKYTGLDNEVYGRKAMIYVTFDTQENRRNAERTLRDQGFKVSDTYDPKRNTAEVQVSYFKGWHWDE
jgi:hypothetical protein